VVKVQFPEAERHFRNDIRTIKSFCALAQPAHLPFLNEVEKQFMTEFDYRREAANLAQVRSNLEASPYAKQVVVPAPFPEYCTKEVHMILCGSATFYDERTH
jgi:aarF domain-containing kinase